jgi:hypothetical protein
MSYSVLLFASGLSIEFYKGADFSLERASMGTFLTTHRQTPVAFRF